VLQDAGKCAAMVHRLTELVTIIYILNASLTSFVQIPRIDISSPANSIEYHPALLAHAEENSGGVGNGAANTGITNEAIQAASTQMKASPFSQISTTADNCDSLGSDMSDDYDDVDGGDDYFDHLSLSDDDSVTSSESAAAALASLPPADQAENERFGVKYEGPTLTDKQASRLLLLMAHASTCPCRYVILLDACYACFFSWCFSLVMFFVFAVTSLQSIVMFVATPNG